MITDFSKDLLLHAAAGHEAAATVCAQTYGFTLVASVPEDQPHWLVLDEQGLALHSGGPQAPGPLRVDFVEGAAAHRRKFGGGRGQPVAKAIGLKGDYLPHVLDATAGLGGDSFVFATLGCQVTLCERTALAAALLADGLARAMQNEEVAEIAGRMTLQHVDAHAFLASQVDAAFDVVFLDPMFPEKNKTAKAKKGMLVFQHLLSGDPDADALLQSARRVAGKRVVVKRPKGAPFLADSKPSGSQVGESTRFDLYAPLKPAAEQ
ncbi:class I SAM-dependent methyltransferase [Leeia oryzae]|uniref:class I SAM-dependent methyltransferase n=1 Tax=Leeia oryzae TaxID=356662 RepID=UPI00036EAC3C|nr:class I SAM-dependent methyltransferase [Leeia oryzae]